MSILSILKSICKVSFTMLPIRSIKEIFAIIDTKINTQILRRIIAKIERFRCFIQHVAFKEYPLN